MQPATLNSRVHHPVPAARGVSEGFSPSRLSPAKGQRPPWIRVNESDLTTGGITAVLAVAAANPDRAPSSAAPPGRVFSQGDEANRGAEASFGPSHHWARSANTGCRLLQISGTEIVKVNETSGC